MAGTVPSELPAYTACKFLQIDSGQKAWQGCCACSPVLPSSGTPGTKEVGPGMLLSSQDTPMIENDPALKRGETWSGTHLSLSQSLFQKHQTETTSQD